MNLDWGYAFGEFFDDGKFPWQIDFYSDQTAAATEAIQNKQNRMNTLMVVAQGIGGLKEVGLSQEVNAKLLEQIGGFDYDDALDIAKSLKANPMDVPVDDGEVAKDDELGEFDEV